MVSDRLKIAGITISLSWLAFLALAVFLKALGVIMNPYFTENAVMIAWISGIFVLFLVIIGAISIGSIKRKGGIV